MWLCVHSVDMLITQKGIQSMKTYDITIKARIAVSSEDVLKNLVLMKYVPDYTKECPCPECLGQDIVFRDKDYEDYSPDEKLRIIRVLKKTSKLYARYRA